MKRVSKFFSILLLFLFVAFAFSLNSVKALNAEVEFVKVTSGDVSNGKYLIVYEDGSKAYVFNSTLSTLDAVKNYVEASINDDKITISEDYAFTIEGKNIISNSGKYIYQSANSNGMQASDTEKSNDSITINSDKTVAIVAASAHLRFNKESGQMRFRYYKRSSYTSQQAICLYKMESALEDGISKLEYELNGGVNVNDAPTTYEEGQVVTLPTPTKEGYEFLGWYLNSEFSGDSITEISASQTGDVKVYAKWAEEVWHMFSALRTSASLNIEYDMIGNDAAVSTYTMKYDGSSTTNMNSGNNASLVNLDANKFTVSANENNKKLYPGLNSSDKQIRLYAGNYITISSTVIKFASIEVTINQGTIKLFAGEEEITASKSASTYTYELNYAEEFIIKQSGSDQLRISEIVLNCSESAIEYNNIDSKIRFGTCIDKELFDNLGDNVTYGVALIKTENLGSNELTEETQGVILTNITPAQVTTPFGTEESSEGNYYQFAVVVAGLDQEDYDLSLTARAYVIIEGEYYFMEASEYSIKSLSEYYLEVYNTDDNIKSHFGVLKHIIG